jgi:hypothetical protein
MDSKWIWLAAAAAGVYVLYEWLSSQCETVGSSFYGGSICGSLFSSAAATVQIPTQVTASSATAAQAQVLAAYGLPADATPSAIYPTGSNCTVVNPVQSGYDPVPGAPFYSPSLQSYICGPASVWQQMQTPALPVVSPAVPATPIQTAIPTSAQANAGPSLTQTNSDPVMYPGGSPGGPPTIGPIQICGPGLPGVPPCTGVSGFWRVA